MAVFIFLIIGLFVYSAVSSRKIGSNLPLNTKTEKMASTSEQVISISQNQDALSSTSSVAKEPPMQMPMQILRQPEEIPVVPDDRHEIVAVPIKKKTTIIVPQPKKETVPANDSVPIKTPIVTQAEQIEATTRILEAEKALSELRKRNSRLITE